MCKRVIINADDFGLCRGVNEAVAEACSEGVLTSATIMANMPAAGQAAEMAKELPGLGVGVHLNPFEGRPLSDRQTVECLLDSDGNFFLSPERLSLLSAVNGRIRRALEAEFTAQIQWVIGRGIKPTHLDSHKHIHSFPVIYPVVCRLALRFDIPCVRFAYEPAKIRRTPWPAPAVGGKKRAFLLGCLGRINHLQNSDLLKTQATIGIAHTGKIDVDFFRAAALYNSMEVVEIMTHPGYTEGLQADKTRLLHQRKMELDALCSEKTKRCFRNGAIKLVNYGTL